MQVKNAVAARLAAERSDHGRFARRACERPHTPGVKTGSNCPSWSIQCRAVSIAAALLAWSPGCRNPDVLPEWCLEPGVYLVNLR